MHSVINKLGLFPEWHNFTEAETNFNQAEENFVRSIDTLAEEKEDKFFKVNNFSYLSQQIQYIANSLSSSNISLGSVLEPEMKKAQEIYDKFQTKKLDKFKYDNAYKRAIKRSNDIHEMLEKRRNGIFESTDFDDDDDQPKPGSSQAKYDQDYDLYQKAFVQNMSNIFGEVASSRMRTSAKICEIGSLLKEKASNIEIVHKQTENELSAEMKKLHKVVRKNKKMLDKEFTVDECEDDEIIIVKEEKGIVDVSDEEEEEEENISTNQNIATPKVQIHGDTNNMGNIKLLAGLILDNNGNQFDNSSNDTIPNNPKQKQGHKKRGRRPKKRH
ncbi:hypothetical protein TRFO_34872 [Tritrichomonas foetus]|uniref:Uncharacterized protein n=1 Tax=Tritrichomonas foetus TaxID=1144522 RepID=A0A1J4JJ89_9EUKA|nr:hypothetical protein TRFO_34872 [Tritrichomonas foetus]|eukprot:OHS98657.1 hypothetical protein TRFO_34872 [Tritrichomonas foetus]